ncbi:hypothetical protein FJZ18_01705 [Candidatus Pacearchaeota archaeon]|nr:hypothetical protein [Candidatus Pacearchaeota archaeon]
MVPMDRKMKVVFSRFKFCYLVLLVSFIFSLSCVSAFNFNGTVYDINGNPLANATINITTRSVVDWSIVAYNATTSNESGWFNITMPDVATWLYSPQITHKNISIPTANYTDYVGQSLPAFPSFMFDTLGSLNSYLREAGSFNLTAINASGGRIAFNYQIKDTSLGYPIAESFNWASGGIFEANVVVPANRNYSVMIFPNQSLRVSFEWNNFTSRATYNITTLASGNNISHYNGTTRTVHKQVNITLSMPRVNGTINFTSAINVAGLDNLSVIAYLMESGNMIHASMGGMFANMSAFTNSFTDLFNTTTGVYNMSLPASAESTSYMLFATGRNGTNYLGAFANLTIQYGAAPVNIDFVLRGLIGNLSYIGLDVAGDFSAKKLFATAKQTFQLVNKSNHSISQAFSHMEVTVNYSQWGAPEFTWIEDVPQTGNGNFSLPLLNVTGIKEMNIFVGGDNYAPKRISPRIDQILSARHLQGGTNNNLSAYNITINSFSPGDIDGQVAATSISMSLYISNSSCDVPSPASTCLIGGSGQNMSSFNPMGAIMGGGKLSFRMGTGNISVHYVNVDMMASGPPDALFDDSTTDRTSGSSFDQAVRFGSGGPNVYDFILVSIPYTETAGSGLNDANDVNMTIPTLYDDDWKVMWNTTANGSAASSLSGNFSHYVAKQTEWNYLLGQTNCTTTASELNASRPCYIDKTGNVIWIRLPHFSGTGPSIVGTTVASTTTPAASTDGGRATTTNTWKQTIILSETQVINGYSANLGSNERVKLTVNNEEHSVGVLAISATTATIQVASTPQNATLTIGESKKFEVTNDSYYDLKVTLNSITGNKANFTIISIREEMSSAQKVATPKADDVPGEQKQQQVTKDQPIQTRNTENNNWYWVLVVAIVLVIVIIVAVSRSKRH